MKVHSLSNYIWVIYILGAGWLIATLLNKPLKRPEQFDIFVVTNIIFLTFTTISSVFLSLQTRTVWTGGISEPMQGIYFWGEIHSFRFEKEGPYEFEHYYHWFSKTEYLLVFQIITFKKKGWNETLIRWKITGKMKDEVLPILRSKIPDKEITNEEDQVKEGA